MGTTALYNASVSPVDYHDNILAIISRVENNVWRLAYSQTFPGTLFYQRFPK
jgi:hypothetical protein